ncbi:hypothetical protein FBQ97_07015, partial [Acidobacteria bacterium ACD]|nr:hypothetical protein [Acidobacteria bacterium ACD]
MGPPEAGARRQPQEELGGVLGPDRGRGSGRLRRRGARLGRHGRAPRGCRGRPPLRGGRRRGPRGVDLQAEPGREGLGRPPAGARRPPRPARLAPLLGPGPARALPDPGGELPPVSAGAPRRLALLGATGSIGRSALSVVETFPDRFRVVSMSAGRNVEALLPAISACRPALVSVSRREDAERLRAEFPGLRV